MPPRLDFHKLMNEGMVSAVKQTLPDVEYNLGKFSLPSSEVDRATVIAALIAARDWFNEAVELMDSEASRLSHLPEHDWNSGQVERVRYNVTAEIQLMPTEEAFNGLFDEAASKVKGK
ncbi:hypothetical protein ACI2I2_19555 [Scandinavium sp. NPDC088450]|uniref:hypothetical protein n=1 Tax=Scandinavium sp. NPDC088450 TaxID=3364514 RepID=UPI00384AEA05